MSSKANIFSPIKSQREIDLECMSPFQRACYNLGKNLAWVYADQAPVPAHSPRATR